MTDERIRELRSHYDDWTQSIGDAKNEVEECLDEIVRLKASEQVMVRVYDVQAAHIRRLREALDKIVALCRSFDHGNCSSAELRLWVRNWSSKASLLAETEPERGYQPRNPTPLDPMTMKPPTGGSAVVEPR